MAASRNWIRYGCEVRGDDRKNGVNIEYYYYYVVGSRHATMRHVSVTIFNLLPQQNEIKVKMKKQKNKIIGNQQQHGNFFLMS